MTEPAPALPQMRPTAIAVVLGSFALGFALAPKHGWLRLVVGLAVVVSAYGVQILEPRRRSQRDLPALAVLLVGLGLALMGPDMRTGVLCFGLIVACELAYDYATPLRRWPARRLLVYAAATTLLPLAYGYASGQGRPVSWIAMIALGLTAVSWSLTAISEDRRRVRGFFDQYGAATTARASLAMAALGYFGVLATLATLSPNPWFTLGIVAVAAFAGADIGQRRWLLKSAGPAQMTTIARRSVVLLASFEWSLALCLFLLVQL